MGQGSDSADCFGDEVNDCYSDEIDDARNGNYLVGYSGGFPVPQVSKGGVKLKSNPVSKSSRIEHLMSAYKIAKSAAVGTVVKCPVCGINHTKSTYHKVFCSNNRTKKGKNCKDFYWNSVDSKRAERANIWRDD